MATSTRGGATTECPPPADVLGRIGRWSRWDAELEAARLARPGLVWQAQRGYDLLFGSALADDARHGDIPYADVAFAETPHAEPPGRGLEPDVRRALAARVARWHGATVLVRHHRDLGADPALLRDEPPVDPRLCAAVDLLDLIAVSPALATEGDQRRLAVAGWTPDQVVELAQRAAFTSFQAKLLAGLDRLGGRPAAAANPPARTTIAHGRTRSRATLAANGGLRPTAYTLEPLDWTAWVPPVPADHFPPDQPRSEQGIGFVGDASGEYARLLARAPELLRARTRMAHCVFAGPGGLPPAERELAALVASRVNDCIHDASVHARRAVRLSGRTADVRRLLEVSLHRDSLWRPVDLGLPGEGQPPRSAAIVDFAAALAATPSMPTTSHVRQLRAHGLGLDQVLDLVAAVAFASWENRLTLALGEPFRPGTAYAQPDPEPRPEPEPASEPGPEPELSRVT